MLSTTCVFWFLRVYNSVTKITETGVYTAKKIFQAVYGVFVPESFIFFKGIAYPYPEAGINTATSVSATPLWRYLPETKEFFSWGPEASFADLVTSHTLPVLSMDIYEGKKLVYDLTDFIEKIRVYDHRIVGMSPCIAHILSAWTVSSGVVLDPSRPFKVHYITDEADTVEADVNNMDIIKGRSVELEAKAGIEAATEAEGSKED
jgi:hypothetical protein